MTGLPSVLQGRLAGILCFTRHYLTSAALGQAQIPWHDTVVG